MIQENVTFPPSFLKHDGVFTTAFWQIADLSQSTVSHGLCPQCFKISEKEITDYFIKTTPENK